MLEHQNLALAKQYFSSQQENESLREDNSGFSSKMQELESYCASYQTILQMIYTKINSIVSDFSRSVVCYLFFLVRSRVSLSGPITQHTY